MTVIDAVTLSEVLKQRDQFFLRILRLHQEPVREDDDQRAADWVCGVNDTLESVMKAVTEWDEKYLTELEKAAAMTNEEIKEMCDRVIQKQQDETK